MKITRRQLLISTGVFFSPSFINAYDNRTPWQSAGPYYPDSIPEDSDNNLVQVGNEAPEASGEILHLKGSILNQNGIAESNMNIEIWQTDKNGIYIHSSAPGQEKRDLNFQGFGRTISNENGEFHFKTIIPVQYFGRPPHIHLLIRKNNKLILITQLYLYSNS